MKRACSLLDARVLGGEHQDGLARVCVVDAERYPGFFELRGQRYLIEIRKAAKS